MDSNGGPFTQAGPLVNGLQQLPFRGGVDGGVSVLAIVLRFTIWVLLILAAVWLLREILTAWRIRRAAAPPPLPPAVAELDMLYARGEVSRADYLVRRADLIGTPPEAPPAA
ncbi:MAG TPA: hypothetical protein VH661_09750 [Candidatus Dormibacteraeota bacterium]|jgi:hypothetical protein|nr:hypothetical protein [Candidatus Dormibacteraeota bacterium]